MSTPVDVIGYAAGMTGGYDPEQFGDWLRERLRRRGWNPSTLAAAMGVPRMTVHRWLRGERRPSYDNAKLIGRVLGVGERMALYYAAYETDVDPVELDIREELNEARVRLDNVRELERRLDLRWRSVEVWGRVPADTIRYTQDEELDAVEVAESALNGAQNPFGLLIVGDCMRSLGMYSGDVLICDRDVDRKPKDGELVVVRLPEGVTFKRWCVIDGLQVELRDGDGAVAHTINAVMDEYHIEGFYVTFLPLAVR